MDLLRLDWLLSIGSNIWRPLGQLGTIKCPQVFLMAPGNGFLTASAYDFSAKLAKKHPRHLMPQHIQLEQGFGPIEYRQALPNTVACAP